MTTIWTEFREIQILLDKVFNMESKCHELDTPDPHIEIGQTGFEIWASERTCGVLDGRVIVRTWELYEDVHIPSTDRDTPDDYDSMPRGVFKSAYEVVAAAMVAITKRDIEGKLEAYGEEQMLKDELAAESALDIDYEEREAKRLMSLAEGEVPWNLYDGDDGSGDGVDKT